MSTQDIKNRIGTTFTPLLDEHVAEPNFDLGHCALLGRLYYMGLQKDGVNKGAKVNISAIAVMYKMTRQTATQKLGEASDLGYVHIERTPGGKSHYTVYITPAHNPHLSDFTTGGGKKSDNRMPLEEELEDHTTYDGSDPLRGTHPDALLSDGGSIRPSLKTNLRSSETPYLFNDNRDNFTKEEIAQMVENLRKIKDDLCELDIIVEHNNLPRLKEMYMPVGGYVRFDDDDKVQPVLDASMKTNSGANTGEGFIAPDGKKYANMDAWWATVGNTADDDNTTRVYVDEDGNEDKKNRTKSPVEKRILSWCNSNGLKIKSLSSSSLYALEEKLPNSAKNLLQVGIQLMDSDLGKSALAVLTKRKSGGGFATPFNQRDVINVLRDVYPDWRKSQEYLENPELVALEEAILKAFGQTANTLTPDIMSKLRDRTIAPLHSMGCRADHIPQLVAGMGQKKTEFLLTEWKNRGADLAKHTVEKVKFVPAPIINPYE